MPERTAAFLIDIQFLLGGNKSLSQPPAPPPSLRLLVAWSIRPSPLLLSLPSFTLTVQYILHRSLVPLAFWYYGRPVL